jgi:hypothetical protein
MIEKLLSRKFVLAVLGAVAVLLRDWLGLSPEAVQQIVTLVAAYILGEGAVDAAAAFKKPAVTDVPDVGGPADRQSPCSSPPLGQAKSGVIGLVVLCCSLPLLSGCFGGRTPEIREVEQGKRRAILLFAENSERVTEGTLAGYRMEAYSRVDDRHAWDQERITSQAQDAIVAKANEQGKAPKDATFTAAELAEFAALARSWSEKISKEATANKAKVDAVLAATRQLVVLTRKDLVTALELQSLLDQFYEAGIPLESITQAGQMIESLLARKQEPTREGALIAPP